MPFIVRQVEPVFVSRGLVIGGGGGGGGLAVVDERTHLSNASLTSCLRQLACLVGLAAEIFAGVECEAVLVQRRAQRLRGRLRRIEDAVGQLECRNVDIRESYLPTYLFLSFSFLSVGQLIPERPPVGRFLNKQSRFLS